MRFLLSSFFLLLFSSRFTPLLISTDFLLPAFILLLLLAEFTVNPSFFSSFLPSLYAMVLLSVQRELLLEKRVLTTRARKEKPPPLQRNMQIWYMEPYPCGDRRLPHHVFPPKNMTPDQLHSKTGVQYFKVDLDDTVAMKKRLSRVKNENNIVASDVFTISDTITEIEEKLEEYYEPVVKEENVVSLIMDGACYFDVEPEEDEWIRVHLERGDLLVIPKGLFHRLTTTPKNFVQMQRFFAKSVAENDI